jgi:acyl carrier protein
MGDTEILQKLDAIFRDVFDDPSVTLTMQTTADDIPEWDSMNHITIVVETEKRFGLKFKTAEIEELKDVGDLVHLIRAKLEKVAG